MPISQGVPPWASHGGYVDPTDPMGLKGISTDWTLRQNQGNTSPSMQGLSQAISGPAVDPMQQFDQGQQARYAAQDADPNLNKGPGYPSSYSNTVNRIQDAGAVGPEGYNRSQVPFIQSVATRHVTGLGGPQDTPAAPQEGPFGAFGAGTGGNMPSALPPMAGLNMALANKNLKWSGR